jgi:hypothetical protein
LSAPKKQTLFNSAEKGYYCGCMKTRFCIIISLSLCLAVLVAGCGAAPSASDSASSASADGSKSVFKPKHRTADHKVIVLVGPEFATRPEVLDGLISEYGLDGAGGMVVRLQYPDSLLDGKRVKLSLLSDAVETSGATTLVTVGAPEGVAVELTRLRARKPDLRIVSLFSADDMLPVEAASGLTLEYAPPAGILADENTTVMPSDGIDVLVLAAVLAIEDPDPSISPLLRMQTSLDSARSFLRKKSVGSDWKITAWADPDTNIRSRVRLVLSSGAT